MNSFSRFLFKREFINEHSGYSSMMPTSKFSEYLAPLVFIIHYWLTFMTPVWIILKHLGKHRHVYGYVHMWIYTKNHCHKHCHYYYLVIIKNHNVKRKGIRQDPTSFQEGLKSSFWWTWNIPLQAGVKPLHFITSLIKASHISSCSFLLWLHILYNPQWQHSLTDDGCIVVDICTVYQTF